MAVALALSLAAASYTLPSGTPTTAGHHCRLRRPTCVATEDATAGNSLESEVGRRRNLAIISHPDAGKTTLTEKLLLYGGAINQAGAVKAKGEQRRATSDFMELEQQRGISISSSVLSYEYDGKVVSILDTPGHQDFSEDTYRTLSAADNAVMLVDAAKGLEPQTRKLFEVAHLRRLPLFTFVNKMDRPALSPFEIIDQIENEFGLVCSPVLWPIGSGDRFKGVLDRTNDQVHLFERAARGAVATELTTVMLDDPELAALIGDAELYDALIEEVEMLKELTPEIDMQAVGRGEMTPVFFGSAMTNFGVGLFLDAFMRLGSSPVARSVEEAGAEGRDFTTGEIAEEQETIDPTTKDFSGFVFKLQANLDPKHRDRLAYVRICSGRFERGMKVKHARLKGKELTLSSVQTMMANSRSTVEEAYPGDVIGIANPAGTFAIGDTIYTGGKRISYSKIPSFSPEVFARCINTSPAKSKQFSKGISQLLDEGAVQQLRERGDQGGGAPIVAAVGPLQFEVVQARMLSEYGVDVRLETIPYSCARWAMAGWDDVDAADADNQLYGVMQLEDAYGRPVLLFNAEWKMNKVVADSGERLQLRPFAVAPDVEERRRK
jgi:peptide chain release factor 3